MSIIYIDKKNDLKPLAALGQRSDRLALDTEFDRSKTFYARLGLIQLTYSADPTNQYLIDPVELGADVIAQESGLVELFQNEKIVKILHACGEDVDVLLHFFGLKDQERPIQNLFDTQIAAAFLNMGSQIGYRELVKHFMAVTISKEETRSNWFLRPLSDDQIRYAAKDAEFLLPCYEALHAELKAKERLAWVREDSMQYIDACQQAEAIDQYYLKFQQGWNLDQQQVSLLKNLCVWREETARRMDTPRTHIVRDSSLLEIAEKQPSSMKSLLRMKSLQGRSRDIRHMKRYADQILHQVHVIDEEKERAADGTALQPIEKPLDRDLKTVFKQCKTSIGSIAERLELPQDRLLAKSELRRFVASYAHHLSTGEPLIISSQMRGWRYEILFEPLKTILDQFKAQLVEQYEKREQKAAKWQQDV